MSNDEKIAQLLTSLVELLNENGDSAFPYYGVKYGKNQFATIAKVSSGATLIIAHPVCKNDNYSARNIIALEEAREFAVDDFAYALNVIPPSGS